MQVKSPSKHTSLNRLIEIQKNNYIGLTGIEYCENEVDLMIFQKQTKLDILNAEKLIREHEKMENAA